MAEQTENAKLKRDTTMDITVKEGKEFIGEHGKNADCANGSSHAHRQSTMETTAAEGIQYLKQSRKDTLLEAQGLVSKPNDESNEENGTATARLGKHTTMAATTEEAQAVLDALGGEPDKDVRTRGQQKQLDQLLDNNDTTTEKKEDQQDNEEQHEEDGPEKKKLRRDGTMTATAKEAEHMIGGDTLLGGSRAQTAAIHDATSGETDNKIVPPSPKKTHTMTATVAEGEAFLKNQETGGGDHSGKKAVQK